MRSSKSHFNTIGASAMALVLMAGAFAWSSPPQVQVSYRLQEARSGLSRAEVATADIPLQGGTTDRGIEKTIQVAKIALVLKTSLADFEKACATEVPLPDRPGPSNCIPGTTFCPRPMPPKPRPPCAGKRATVAGRLSTELTRLSEEYASAHRETTDPKVIALIDLGLKLSSNMKSVRENPLPPPPRPSPDPRPAPRPVPGGSAPRMPAPGGVSVTTGGAKDMGYIRKLIQDGLVPAAENLVIEGVLSEFDLNLAEMGVCRELICLKPAVSVDRDAKKMYVQFGMSSSVTPETFKRPALNLALVIDVSGSMGADDGTGKNRLEWAKDAAIRTAQKLEEGDLLSIVLFDDRSRVLVSPTAMTASAKERVIASVRALQLGGSTNLEAGLHQAYDLVSSKHSASRESRLILLSDAGLNTGVTDESSITRLVSDHAAEKIGLTAFGIGEDFKQNLIQAITLSRGGNYLFVQSGAKMFEVFRDFDFLVTPIAYDFKASVAMEGVNAKLARAYGVPATAGSPVRELIDVRTLFFAGEGGGAILLEYDLM